MQLKAFWQNIISLWLLDTVGGVWHSKLGVRGWWLSYDHCEFRLHVVTSRHDASCHASLILIHRLQMAATNGEGSGDCWRVAIENYSSIAALPQSPLPSRPHSWLPSTNPLYFTLASLHFLFSSPFPSSCPHLSSTSLPTRPIICPYSYIISEEI